MLANITNAELELELDLEFQRFDHLITLDSNARRATKLWPWLSIAPTAAVGLSLTVSLVLVADISSTCICIHSRFRIRRKSAAELICSRANTQQQQKKMALYFWCCLTAVLSTTPPCNHACCVCNRFLRPVGCAFVTHLSCVASTSMHDQLDLLYCDFSGVLDSLRTPSVLLVHLGWVFML